MPATYEKYRHRVSFGISVYEDYWHWGLGTAILTQLIACARELGYEQLELDVNCDNSRAFALYQKMGFQVYGTLEHSFKFRDGTYGDAHLMVLKL